MAVGVEDVTHLLGKEEGSAFDQDTLMYGSFQGGGVFAYEGMGFVRDMKDMLTGDTPDPKAQTLESVLSLPIRSAPYYIDGGRARKEVTETVERVLMAPANNGGMSTTMNLVVAQMCSAFVYKKAFFEKVWKEIERPDNRTGVGYDKIAWRPPGTCAIERDEKNGSFQGFRQMPIRLEDTEEKRFSPQRSFVYIHGSHRDPLDGVSDLLVTQWCFKTKQKIRFLWYQFLEGQALPKTVVKAADETEAKQAARTIVGLRQGGVVGVSDRVSTDMLESSGRGATEFKSAMQWLDSEASSSVLAGFTDLGAAAASGIGSFALSKDQTDFFQMSRQAESREMEDFINSYVVADIVRWNFGPNEVAPRFRFGPISQDDTATAVGLLQATAQTPVNQSVLPQEFFDELSLKVAGYLELDVVTVREGLERARKEAEQQAALSPDPTVAANPQVAGVKAAVDTATNAVQQQAIAKAREIPGGI